MCVVHTLSLFYTHVFVSCKYMHPGTRTHNFSYHSNTVELTFAFRSAASGETDEKSGHLLLVGSGCVTRPSPNSFPPNPRWMHVYVLQQSAVVPADMRLKKSTSPAEQKGFCGHWMRVSTTSHLYLCSLAVHWDKSFCISAFLVKRVIICLSHERYEVFFLESFSGGWQSEQLWGRSGSSFHSYFKSRHSMRLLFTTK